MRLRIALCALSLLALAGFHLQPSAALPTPSLLAAHHSVPVAPSGPDSHQSADAFNAALRAAHVDQVGRWYAWAAAQPAPAPVRPVRSSTPSGPVATPAYDPGSIEALILDAFGSTGAKALSVARCESGLIASAANGRYRGIFQVGDMHAAQWLEVTGLDYWSSWMDAATNVTFAHWLWTQAGWGPWSCA